MNVVFGRLAVLRLPVLCAWLMLVLRELSLCRFFVSVVLAAVQYYDLLLVFGFLSCRFFVNVALGALQYYDPPPSLELGLCWFFVNVVSGRFAVLRPPFLGAWFVQVLCE